MEKKPFYRPIVVIRSIFNPLRYIFGKVKIIWAQTLSDYAAENIDLDVKDIKFYKDEEVV